jgi:UDP-glucose 4-epimerase
LFKNDGFCFFEEQEMRKFGKVVVTGGAGFIGSHIADALAMLEAHVIIIDNLSTGKTENIQHLVADKRAEFICASILNLPLLQEIFKGVDYVFHEAAIPGVPQSIVNPLDSHNANITGTLNVLIAARDNKVKKLVFASSCAVYGNEPTIPKGESSVLDLVTPYAATKLAAEHYCEVFNRIYGLPTACLRYFNVYGPRQDPKSEYAAVIPKFLKRIGEGKEPQIYGDGTQSRDFVYVSDVVAANLLVAKSSAVGEFNIGSGNKTTLNELVKTIGSLFDRDGITPEYLPARSGDIKHSLADISKSNSFGYSPQYTIEKGLSETILSMRNQKQAKSMGGF